MLTVYTTDCRDVHLRVVLYVYKKIHFVMYRFLMCVYVPWWLSCTPPVPFLYTINKNLDSILLSSAVHFSSVYVGGVTITSVV